MYYTAEWIRSNQIVIDIDIILVGTAVQSDIKGFICNGSAHSPGALTIITTAVLNDDDNTDYACRTNFFLKNYNINK